MFFAKLPLYHKADEEARQSRVPINYIVIKPSGHACRKYSPAARVVTQLRHSKLTYINFINFLKGVVHAVAFIIAVKLAIMFLTTDGYFFHPDLTVNLIETIW